MKFIKSAIYLVFAGAIISCGSAEPAKNGNTKINKPENPPAVNKPANLPEKVEEPANKSKEPVPKEIYPKESYSQKTPTEAVKTYIMATVNKDTAAIKKIISKSSLEFIEDKARQNNVSVDEILTGGGFEDISQDIPEMRNEKITGNTARVEFKDESISEFLSMPLVKEDGEWKVALDVFQRELLEKLRQDMNRPVN